MFLNVFKNYLNSKLFNKRNPYNYKKYSTIVNTRLNKNIQENIINRRNIVNRNRLTFNDIYTNLDNLKNIILKRKENDKIKRNKHTSKQYKKNQYKDNKKVMCSNKPNSIYTGLIGYMCKLHIIGEYLEKSRAKVDHIDEFSLTYNDTFDNMRLLCADCHDEKTIRFQQNNSLLLSSEIDNGYRIKDNKLYNIMHPNILIDLN